MANDYYSRLSEMNPGELADGLAIEQEFDAIARGFAMLPTPHRDGNGFEGATRVGDPASESDAVNLKKLNEVTADIEAKLLKNSGDPVLAPKWMRKRSSMWEGYAPEDGQLLSRALYPDAWARIEAGLEPVCTDAEWLADPAKRGCFTPGDGSTTFRVPDTNGVYPGSYGPVYPSGGSSAGGTILRDRLQNITGTFTYAKGLEGVTSSGALSASTTQPSNSGHSTSTASTGGGTLTFDASLVARTGDTTRPITVEGCWAVRLFGTVQNTGSADAAALATAVAALAARVTALEARKSTCLVNATGTGAEHETVAAALPATVTNNNTYVIPNPFGANVQVWLKAQIKTTGDWFDAGWDGNAGNGNLSYGVTAVQNGSSIKLKTGITAVDAAASLVGSGGEVAVGGAPVTSAQCRVFVTRMDK